MAGLSQALIIFGGITGIVYLGLQAQLKRSDRRIPHRWDRAYVVFGCGLMTAVVINGVIRLLL